MAEATRANVSTDAGDALREIDRVLAGIAHLNDAARAARSAGDGLADALRELKLAAAELAGTPLERKHASPPVPELYVGVEVDIGGAVFRVLSIDDAVEDNVDARIAIAAVSGS